MNPRFLAILGAFAFAAVLPAAPTTFSLPVLIPGENTAIQAAPRLDWVQRVFSSNAKAQEQADKIELIFDGDSITDNWQSTSEKFGGKSTWIERYGNLNAFDFGIAGDRTQHLLWRLAQGQVDGMHPKLVVLMIGTNNLDANSPEEIADGVKAIVAEYQKRLPGAVILLQAVFPRGEKADNPARAKIKAINDLIAKLADGQKVLYVDFGDRFLAPDGSISPDIMSDFLHPTAKGYVIWADAIQPIIDQYFPPKPVGQ